MADVEHEAARTLITPEQTPEPIAQNQGPGLLLPTAESDQSNEPVPRTTDADSLDLSLGGNATESTESPRSTESTKSTMPKAFVLHESKHSKGLSKGISIDNIKTGKRARKPTAFTINRAYTGTNDDYSRIYHSAFTAGTTLQLERLYSRDLPPVPKTYKELSHYTYSDGFKQAARKEWQTLYDQDTFKQYAVAGILLFILPLMWVFTYKLNEDGYLLKYKVRLVVRGDLQVS